tara:strand:- start:62 stop:352 length:291 start_codon:yes stop_codon:yes gene_type:complete
MGGFIMTMLTRELDPIKEEFVQFYVNTMSLDDLIDLAKTYVYESVEELTEDEFKKHCNDNVDEYIYDDLKQYVEEDDPKIASQLWMEIVENREECC